MTKRDRFQGCLLGLACGDAVGTAVEFMPRGSFPPVRDMIGGGPFQLLPGQWTDDTSMALCLADSLVEKRTHNPQDQMERYLRWRDEGYQSSTGTCFDIGNTIADALRQFEETGNPIAGSTDPWSAGNGSLMRLAPIPLFYAENPEKAEYFSGESSRTTHGAVECVDACRLLGWILLAILRGDAKDVCLFTEDTESKYSAKVQEIAKGSYRNKTDNQIKGSGYVVESLEAALWSFWKTDSYEDAVLRAVNLGDDADTTAAVCGQVAGAYYGLRGIPDKWLSQLAMREEIQALADQLHDIKAVV